MKCFFTAALLSLSILSAQAGIEVVYGPDNRKDVYEVSNAQHLKLARSTAGLVALNQFTQGSAKNLFNLLSASLQQSENICSSEKFAQQLAGANCSGFLVAPDIIITAGHCYAAMDTPENVCKNFAWVFDYNMTSANHNPTQNVSANNIYLCKEVVHVELNDSMDFAVIKLHRKATDREPLQYRKTGKISSNASLMVIGHPSGLPTKISDGGKVLQNTSATRFATTLDTFHGNSGSAVLDANTGVVEGILIQGKSDYVPSDEDDSSSCMVVNKCDENGQNCLSGDSSMPMEPDGELVLRMELVAPYLKATTGMGLMDDLIEVLN